ncbi:MAG TPA: hypothetical protein DDW52_28530, partial [Planctomycetaceae bacterium]|nr:hypothetical protein [Planctomycetaceae bacterium]
MANSFKIVDAFEIASQWKAFVQHSPEATFFHSLAMLEAFTATPQNYPLAAACIDDRGAVRAILSSIQITSAAGLARPFSTRNVMFSPPICDGTPEGYEALAALVEWHDGQANRRSLFSEIRLHHEPSPQLQDTLEACGYRWFEFSNYLVDTSRPEAELWNNIGKQTRSSIRRTGRRGVTVVRDETRAGVSAAHRMIRTSLRRSGIPVVDCQLLHSALELMPTDSLQVRLALKAGEPLAASIGVVYQDRYFAWFGGTLRPRGLAPFAAIVWDEIRWSHRRGL